MHILKFIDLCVFEIYGHKLHISWPIARQPALPWQPVCVPLVGGGGSFTCQPPTMKLIGHPARSYGAFELYTFCAPVTSTFDLFSRKLGHLDGRSC